VAVVLSLREVISAEKSTVFASIRSRRAASSTPRRLICWSQFPECSLDRSRRLRAPC